MYVYIYIYMYRYIYIYIYERNANSAFPHPSILRKSTAAIWGVQRCPHQSIGLGENYPNPGSSTVAAPSLGLIFGLTDLACSFVVPNL